MRNHSGLYRQLIKLYPKRYRARYANQIMQTLEDMLADQPNESARRLIWLQAYADLPSSIIQQHITILGGLFMDETPSYIKTNAIIGSGLMAPFFILVASGLLHNQHLTGNQIWMLIVMICLLVLPAIAFLLNAGSYLKWLNTRSGNGRPNVWGRLFDVKHTWPMVTVGGLGLLLFLFVPFHDSAHCMVGNPVCIVHNPNETWQCVDHGFMGGR